MNAAKSKIKKDKELANLFKECKSIRIKLNKNIKDILLAFENQELEAINKISDSVAAEESK